MNKPNYSIYTCEDLEFRCDYTGTVYINIGLETHQDALAFVYTFAITTNNTAIDICLESQRTLIFT